MTAKCTPEQLEMKKKAMLERRAIKATPKRRLDCKFKTEYANQLIDGIRYKKQMSIAHLCMKWKISLSTYHRWIENYPEFAAAAAVGETHYHAYLMDKMHESLEGGKVNAATLQFALANVCGWASKHETKSSADEEVKRIVIEMLPQRAQPLIIEHQANNVVQLIEKIPATERS